MSNTLENPAPEADFASISADHSARVRSMRFDRYYAGAIVAAAFHDPLGQKTPEQLADRAMSIACAMIALRTGDPK